MGVLKRNANMDDSYENADSGFQAGRPGRRGVVPIRRPPVL